MKTSPYILAAVFTAAAFPSCSTSPEADSFALADANNDNKISRKEASDALVVSVHYAYDTNKDGNLTFAEWKEHESDASMQLFKRRDTDGNGAISLSEAQASADRQKVFSDVFKEADTNKDGLLSREEGAAYAAKSGS